MKGFSTDPVLSESIKQTSFLEQIEKNTKPPGGTTPPL